MDNENIKKIILEAINYYKYDYTQIVDDIDLFDDNLVITKNGESYIIDVISLRLR